MRAICCAGSVLDRMLLYRSYSALSVQFFCPKTNKEIASDKTATRHGVLMCGHLHEDYSTLKGTSKWLRCSPGPVTSIRKVRVLRSSLKVIRSTVVISCPSW